MKIIQIDNKWPSFNKKIIGHYYIPESHQHLYAIYKNGEAIFGYYLRGTYFEPRYVCAPRSIWDEFRCEENLVVRRTMYDVQREWIGGQK